MPLRRQLSEAIALNNNLNDKEKDTILECLADELYIRDILDKKPSQISGGQRRRFGIAKILSINPEIYVRAIAIFILDPTSTITL